MSTSLTNLCVIPAKAHSTRLPGKNTALLAGKPLVVWTIEVAQRSGIFDRMVVSTDDEAIADLCRRAGADVPFLRDASLSRDLVEVPAVVRHALRWLGEHENLSFQWVCTLQPTSPLRTAEDITASRALVDSAPDVDTVTSVSRYHHHPYWALRVDGRRIRPRRPEDASKSRQDLPDLFHPDGTVTWQRAADILQGKGVYEGCVLAYFTPPTSVLDIDHPEDLEFARWRLEGQPSATQSNP